MRKQCSSRAEPQQLAKDELVAELHAWERQLALCSLDEAIRLIESDKVDKLTGQHICRIAEYDAITIDEERFFDRAFSAGKEVAACLAFAMAIGWRETLDDMLRLRMALLGRRAEAMRGSTG